MKRYNRKPYQTLKEKLLFSLLVTTLVGLAYFLSSCDSNDPEPDPLIGKWSSEVNGNISVSFVIQADGVNYKLSDIEVDGAEWLDFTVKNVNSRISIGELVIIENLSAPIGQEVGIKFMSCSISTDKKELQVDSVIHIQGTNQTAYYNQVLKKN